MVRSMIMKETGCRSCYPKSPMVIADEGRGEQGVALDGGFCYGGKKENNPIPSREDIGIIRDCMKMNLKEAFSKAEILRNANAASLASLASFAGLKPVKQGEHLFRDKENVNTFYIILEGMAALYKLGDNGEKKVIFVCGGGKALNEVILNGLSASVNCEILSDGLVLCLPDKELLSVMEQDFRLTKAVMDSMSLKIRRLYHQLKNTPNSMRGDKKIASKLWKLSLDYGVPCGEGVEIDMDLTITYLADMLGSKRETVSRQVRLLANEGLLIYRQNRFIVPDREKLKNYAKM